jgi:hypothetical protein
MSTMRRWAVGLLLGAIALWVLVVVAVVTTRPEDGANIGAGFLLLLAVPVTVTGVVLLLVAARRGMPETPGVAAPDLTGVARPGSAQAAWSLALGILGILVGIFGVGPTATGSVAITLVGVAVSGTAVLLASAVRHRAATPPRVALGGLVTGIIGLVFAALTVVGLVLDATIG